LDAASAAGELPPQSYGLAVANPPYRREHSGRTCLEPARTRARFEGGGGVEEFTQCAARLLRQGGRFAMVHLSERVAELLGRLSAAGLEPKRIRFAHSKAGEPSRLFLMESVRGGRPGVVVEPPLVLYEGEGQGTGMTSEALAFCPFLGCNP
jgi:tRNA1Val (adenine37-N6)-methyltransferase